MKRQPKKRKPPSDESNSWVVKTLALAVGRSPRKYFGVPGSIFHVHMYVVSERVAQINVFSNWSPLLLAMAETTGVLPAGGCRSKTT